MAREALQGVRDTFTPRSPSNPCWPGAICHATGNLKGCMLGTGGGWMSPAGALLFVFAVALGVCFAHTHAPTCTMY